MGKNRIITVLYFERIRFPGQPDVFRLVRAKNTTSVLPDDEINRERLDEIIASGLYEVVIDRRRISE